MCYMKQSKPISVNNSTFQEDDKKKVSVPVEEAVAKKRRTRTNE